MFHVLTLSALLAPSALAGPPVPVVNGEETSGHSAVGALVVCDGNDCAAFCSGTLVASHWVLTAGHCVEAMLYDYGVVEVQFALGSDVRRPDGREALAPAAQGQIHPRYHEDLEHDIGLVRLGTGLDGFETQEVVAGPPSESWLGEELRYVGFGVTAEDAEDNGVKRQADIALDGWDDQWLFAYDPEEEANLCWGDSGGAALLPLEDGGYAQVGVQSWVYDDDDTPCVGGSSGAARVDAHLAWIGQQVDVVEVEIEEPSDETEDDENEDEGEDEAGDDEDEDEGEDEDSAPSVIEILTDPPDESGDEISVNTGFSTAQVDSFRVRIGVFNEIFRVIFDTFRAALGDEAVLDRFGRFLKDDSLQYPSLFRDLGVGKDGTLKSASLIQNLADAEPVDSDTYLHQGLYELIYVHLYDAKDVLTPEQEQSMMDQIAAHEETLHG